jgi:Ca-activated chloride channel family protein
MKVIQSLFGVVFVSLVLFPAASAGAEKPLLPGGELRILDQDGNQVGACPLQHTDVEADIAGFVSRVRVRQTFHNSLDKKIEAVYVFPLPHDAAVDDMVMTVGDRRIVGQIKPRTEAREIYEAARAAGYIASLLDQERPNIFTQFVTNVEPGAEIVIELSYVETLQYNDGVFEFVFPVVVGPRYMPGKPTGQQGTGWAPDTTQVPDASRISPPVALPGTRAGHDISVTVRLDAGTEIFDLQSVLHEVNIERTGFGRATVTLTNHTEVPNKDFILRYRLATDAIDEAVLLHTDERGTFFTLILQPPQRVLPVQVQPRELIFVIDHSGSMSGFPLDKAKETMRLAIERMHPQDTFNLLSFSDETHHCFDKPVPNTPENRAKALKYLADLSDAGGTELLPAIKTVLESPADPGRLRIVCLMTDGYVGNDEAIIAMVRQHARTTRVFAFGIGNSVNRFLLDGVAQASRGEAEYVTLQSEAEGAAERFHERISAPVLTDIVLDRGTLPVTEVYPTNIPDLFSHKPLMIHGRLTGPAVGQITLRGNTTTGAFERRIDVHVPTAAVPHPSLASLWARAKVKDLTQDAAVSRSENSVEAMRKEITQLGIDFHLMTQFTSFVAVEELIVTVGGEPTTITVPVEIPDGVSYEGVFGKPNHLVSLLSGAMGVASSSPRPAPPARPMSSSSYLEDLSSNPRQAIGRAYLRGMKSRKGTESKPAPANIARDKLAETLQDLAEKVAREGQEGNLTVGKLRVTDYKVDVVVHLRDTSTATREALTKLGFVQTGESKTTRLLIGTIDVRQLEALAKLDLVIHIAPVVG